jgi:hypothetical protein
MLREALAIAESRSFRLERCHCILLQFLLRREVGGAISLEEVKREYRRIGSDFPHGEVSFPLNLP